MIIFSDVALNIFDMIIRIFSFLLQACLSPPLLSSAAFLAIISADLRRRDRYRFDATHE